jgi:iron complex transport system substrate-binding protein
VRIVSLIPSATEIVFALGLGDALVGVTHECDFPPKALRKPRLTSSALPEHGGDSATIDRHVRRAVHAGSSLYALDADLLERLAPDLILTQELCAVCAVSYDIVSQAVKRLRGDPRIVSLEPSSLDDVFATIRTVAALTATEPAAERVVARLQRRIERLRQRVAGLARPSVLVLEWTDPPMGAGHWTPGLVDIAGGTAVLANPGQNSQTLTWDAIVAADPNDVIVAPCGFGLEATERACRELEANEAWRSLRAVRFGRVHPVDGNAYVNRPGPRLVDSAEIFAGALHGIRSDGPAATSSSAGN